MASQDESHLDEKADRRTCVNYILEALRDLQFGSITLIVQDGVVVQIDRTEKRRFTSPRG
jgi:hypothetical protein